MRGNIADNKITPVRANDMMISKENKNQSRAHNNSFSEKGKSFFCQPQLTNKQPPEQGLTMPIHGQNIYGVLRLFNLLKSE